MTATYHARPATRLSKPIRLAAHMISKHYLLKITAFLFLAVRSQADPLTTSLFRLERMAPV